MDQSEASKLKPSVTRELGSGLEFKDGSYIKSDQYRAYRKRQDEIIALAAQIQRQREGR